MYAHLCTVKRSTMDCYLCTVICVLLSMYCYLCMANYVRLPMYGHLCTATYVRPPMYGYLCMATYVRLPMYGYLCMATYVRLPMYVLLPMYGYRCTNNLIWKLISTPIPPQDMKQFTCNSWLGISNISLFWERKLFLVTAKFDVRALVQEEKVLHLLFFFFYSKHFDFSQTLWGGNYFEKLLLQFLLWPIWIWVGSGQLGTDDIGRRVLW